MKYRQQFIHVSHGGTLRQGRRKLKRPFDANKSLQLILRSSRARGDWSLSTDKNGRRIRHLVYMLARKTRVKVYHFTNSGNHLHLLVRARSRAEFQSYLRALSGMISRIVTGAKKGNPVGKFWDALAFSRVIQWGKDFLRLKYTLGRKTLESLESLFHTCPATDEDQTSSGPEPA